MFSDLARHTRYIDPPLAADWQRLVGPEIAALCRPGRLSGGRLGRTLEVFAANGAAAARVKFEAEAIRRKVNDYLGPGVVGRLAVRQTGPAGGDGGDNQLHRTLGRFRASVKANDRSD